MPALKTVKIDFKKQKRKKMCVEREFRIIYKDSQ